MSNFVSAAIAMSKGEPNITKSLLRLALFWICVSTVLQNFDVMMTLIGPIKIINSKSFQVHNENRLTWFGTALIARMIFSNCLSVTLVSKPSNTICWTESKDRKWWSPHRRMYDEVVTKIWQYLNCWTGCWRVESVPFVTAVPQNVRFLSMNKWTCRYLPSAVSSFRIERKQNFLP